MFVLYRQTTCRILYQFSSVSSAWNLMFPGQCSRRGLMSPVRTCVCTHTQHLPRRMVNHELQFLRRCANLIPDYWYGYNSEEKTEYAKEMHKKIISSLPEKTLIVYTDGSVLDRRGVGACGVGVVIYQSDEIKVQLSIPVSARANTEIAEYTAVETALSHIITNINLTQLDKIQLFCDSQSVITECVYNTRTTEYKDIVTGIRQKMDQIKSEGVCVAMDWVPSHAGVDGNDRADQLAVGAAKKAAALPLDSALITERDVQRSMARFKSITGSKGRDRDYSENVMLAILMKKKKDKKRMVGADYTDNRNPVTPATESDRVVDMNNRRVLFTGMYQDNLHRLVSRARMHGCTIDSKLSGATDFVVYGSCDTTHKADVQKLAYKLGVECVSGEVWERALNRCAKVELPSYSEEDDKGFKWKRKDPDSSDGSDGRDGDRNQDKRSRGRDT